MIYSFHNGQRIVDQYTPLVNAAGEIRYKLSLAHLWLEEIIIGDESVDIETVWDYMDESAWYARAMLEGDEDDRGKYIPIQSEQLIFELSELNRKLEQHRELAFTRLSNLHGIGSDIDQVFDKSFTELMGHANSVMLIIQNTIATQMERQHYHHFILILIVLTGGLGVAIVLQRADAGRNNAFASLRKSEERFRQMAENTSDWFWEVDQDIVYTYASPKVQAILGYTEEEVIGRTPFELMESTEAERIAKIFQPIAAECREFKALENTAISKSGKFVEFESYGVPILGENGELIGYRGVNRDVTEFKLSRSLKEEKAKAEASSQAKSAFLANMSHEIRTPMNGIMGMTEILSTTDLNYEQSRMLGTIHHSSKSLLRIIDDILDISKIEAGKLTLEEAPVDLRSVFEDLIDTLRSIASEADVRIHFTLDPRLPRFIKADAVRLRQIIMNLMSNAVKFSRKTDGSNKGLVKMHVSLSAHGSFMISIEDNGIGMSQEVLTTIFQPFSQAEESSTRKFGGTGLGLSICQSLVDLMGGSISADSMPGVGTTMLVDLPLIEAAGEDDDPDISGLTVMALASKHINKVGISSYLEYKGVKIRYLESESELISSLSETGDETIIFLAQDTASENDRVHRLLKGKFGTIRLLNGVTDRLGYQECILPDCYTLQLSPVNYSDLIKGLALLAGRISIKDDELGQVESTMREEGGMRILLVEDNEINQQVITTQLEMLGYSVIVAEDGSAGLKRWREGGFDLVLTDCQMPVMDGFQLTREIRRIENEKNAEQVPVIAITANALKGESDKCLKAGMDDYLSKPVSMDELQSTLARWLNK